MTSRRVSVLFAVSFLGFTQAHPVWAQTTTPPASGPASQASPAAASAGTANAGEGGAHQSGSAAKTVSSDENERVRELYRRGAAAFEAGELEAARGLFLEAWSIRKTYDIAAVLGQVELTLNRQRDAAEHLDFALRNFAPQQSADSLARVRSALAQVAKSVASLSVSVDQAGAEVSVDGQPVGNAPLSAPLYLDPGRHSIRARAGQAQVVREITAEAGTERSLDLRLANATPPVSHEPAAQSGPRTLPLVLGGAVVLAGAAAGIGFAIAAGNDSEAGSNARRTVGDRVCGVDAPATECAALKDAAQRYDRDRNLSTVSFAVAGAALLATGTYWLITSRPQSASASRVRLSAGATHRIAALWLTGEF